MDEKDYVKAEFENAKKQKTWQVGQYQKQTKTTDRDTYDLSDPKFLSKHQPPRVIIKNECQFFFFVCIFVFLFLSMNKTN